MSDAVGRGPIERKRLKLLGKGGLTYCVRCMRSHTPMLSPKTHNSWPITWTEF